MLNSASAVEDSDERPIVVVVGDLSTYMCRAGETRPFAAEGPITEEMLGCAPTCLSTSSAPPEAAAPCKVAATSRLVSGLRERVRGKSTLVIFPIHSSSDYREKLVMFLFEKLEVRAVIALSDVVADAFGTGLRDSLVLHASPRALTVSRVESGVSVKYTASTAGSLSSLLKRAAADDSKREERCDAKKNGEGNWAEEEEAGWERVNGRKRDCKDASLFPLSSEAPIDLMISAYRKGLVSFFGEEVYQRVASSQGDGNPKTKRRRVDDTEDEYTGAAETNATQLDQGLLGPIITNITDDTPLPVIVTGEALRVAPLLHNFLEDAIRVWNSAYAAADASSPSSSSSPASSSSDSSALSVAENGFASSSSRRTSDLLGLQPLPLAESPWMLSMLGGSLVSQLSYVELGKLRITKEDAFSSKGAIIHWRSVI